MNLMPLFFLGLTIPDDKVIDVILILVGAIGALVGAVAWAVKRYYGAAADPPAETLCEAELHTAKLHAALSERHEHVLREHGTRMDAHAGRVEAALAQLLEVERQEAVTLATMGPTLSLVMNVLNELPAMWAAYGENLNKIHAEMVELRRARSNANGYAGDL